jgi:protein O-GlcNAc transferase
LDPDRIVELNNRGTAFLRFGRHRDAVRNLTSAAEVCEPLSPCHSNLLLSLLYHPQLSPEQVARAHRYTGNLLPERTRPQADRPLRIAYLTPDFHFHPKAFLQIPHLQHYDRNRFELFVYSSAPKEDLYTRQARASADHWRNVANKSPSQISKHICNDRIDILIDITGHFARSPLPVFALRPAPLQISIPGYPATTGLSTVDYKIVDHQTDPPGLTEHLYTEKLFRLSRPIVCYAPPEDAPDVPPLPSRTNGFITFGSFNNRPKLNPPLMALWARILLETPNSRLLFHHTFDGYRRVSPAFRDPIARAFRSHGISSRRLEFIGGVPVPEHLAVLAQADIALDSYPYHGSTTTCECLWMGVPVLTLAGQAHVSRTGVSLLSSIGLKDWVADSPEDYVRKAVEKARGIEALNRLRSSLRARMRRSPLTDGPGYIRALEDSYLTMIAERT